MVPLIFLVSIALLLVRNPVVEGCDTVPATGSIDDFTVTFDLNCTDETVTVTIEYAQYSDNWFGIVFSSSMYGESLLYTTGKSGDAVPEGLYPYTLSSKSSTLSGIVRDSTTNWTELSTVESGATITVQYRQHLDATDFTTSTESVTIRTAYGDSLALAKHDDRSSTLTLDLAATTSAPTESPSAPTISPAPTADPTTASPTHSPSEPLTTSEGTGCDSADGIVPAAGALGDDFAVEFEIDCDSDTVAVTIEYTAYSDNWFGIVFSTNMIGNALIYTEGTSSDSLTAGLYPYSLTIRSSLGVSRDDNDWNMVSEEESGGVIAVKYSQHLNLTEFSRETESVTVRAAWGSILELSYHGHGEYTEGSIELDLLSGGSTFTATDYTLEDVHGALMWSSWAIFVPIGIMASAFRSWLPEEGSWLMVHRAAQGLAVLLTVIGFIIAVVFTAESGEGHFHNDHMRMGLVVVIFAVMQPINALFRAHPPKAGWVDGKPTARVCWEYLHKGSGYALWIVANIAVYLGLRLRGKEVLSTVHLFGWCLLTVVVYAVLSIIQWQRQKDAVTAREEIPLDASNEAEH